MLRLVLIAVAVIVAASVLTFAVLLIGVGQEHRSGGPKVTVTAPAP